jgi:nitroreductase
MKNISNEKLVESMKWRYAVKKFDPAKKLSESDWATLEQSLLLTPSSYGLQPWKFLVINDPKVRAELKAASWNQGQVEDASHFVVFVAKNDVDQTDVDGYIEFAAKTREVPQEKLSVYKQFMESDLLGARKHMMAEWTARQAYIALGNLMTSAALLGVDACPMEGLEPAKYDQILGLEKSGYRTIMACAIGFRSEEDHHSGARKVRKEKKDVILYV